MATKTRQARAPAGSQDWRDQAIAEAHRNVILRHRAAGVPLVLWRDGAVVEVDPNTVELPQVSELAPQA
jgi:hypothetical protein